jgi:hypothetical protein
MKFKFFVPLLIAALMISAWTPIPVNLNPPQENSSQAAATSVQLVVNNKTGETLNLSLKGPATYNWNINPGKTTQTVVPGKYKYTYKACGGQKSGTVEVKKNGKVLTLAACNQKGAKVGGVVNVKIRNNTGGYVQLNLTGPATYSFSLAPGNSTISVIRGKYQYTAWGCGGASISGTKQLGGGKTWTWWCL